jgi:TonB family protein
MQVRQFLPLTLAAALLPCSTFAQTNAQKFPYPGDSQAAVPQAPAPQNQPLLLPKGMLQPNPHNSAVKVFDPPCLSPDEGTSYGYTMQRGAPNKSTEIKAYFWDIRKNIYDHWLLNMPRMAVRPWLKKGIVGIKTTIDKDGTVETPFVTLSAPHEGFDEHAVKSLEEMSPLPPLPDGTMELRTCIFFYYNLPRPQPEQSKPDYDNWLNKPAGNTSTPK